MDPSQHAVTNNEAENRYELHVDDQVAFAEYMRAKERIVFTHTEVPGNLEGEGIASRIVKFALDDAREHGWAVVPLCPFVASYIRRHPDYRDLVTPGFKL